MAWEWLAPTGTVVGAMITAGVGGWLGSWMTQSRQHRFEREAPVLARGREKSDDAIAALRLLKNYADVVANWSTCPTDDDPEVVDRTKEEYERLGRAVEYLTDPIVRSEIELIYNSIGDSFVVTYMGRTDIADAAPMIRLSCDQGLTVLGRYLRNEPAQEPTRYLQKLRIAYDRGHAELERQLAEQDALHGQPNTEEGK